MPPTRDVRGVENLRHVVPDEYKKWVRAAVTVATIAYAVILLAHLWVEPSPVYLRSEAWALLGCLVGMAADRTGKHLVAAYLVLATATLEVISSYYFQDYGLYSFSLAALPLLVLASGMFLGPRAAYFYAVSIGASVPVLVYWGGKHGHGPGLSTQDSASVVGIGLCLLVTAFLFHRFVESFSGLLTSAREDARRAAAEVIDSAPDGMVVICPAGTIDSVNELAARFLGMNLEDLWGMRPEDLPVRPLDDPGGNLALDELVRKDEAEVFLSPNARLALEVRVRPIAGGHSDTSWLILLRDVTQRLEAEDRQRELEVQLRHAQKLEAVGQLAGGVAHDFNNLLTVVAGYADFVEDMSDEGAAEAAEQLRATYQRGNLLTRQLLAFARREVASPAPLDLAQVLRGLEKLLARLVGEQVRVEIVAEEECPIVADRGQLEQVIINLAANARDAMPGGGTLHFCLKQDANDVVLEASDTGVGMDDAIRERIFDPFFTTKPRGKGTGLGLSTVHGIMVQARGRITVASERGRGSTFFLSWPVTERKVQPDQSPQRGALPKRGQGLVLLAEDDPQTRHFIRRVLSEAGFEVLEAQNGAEALSLAVNLERAPDLFLSDIVMPGMSGVELIQRVRKQYPQAPFLFVSGYTDNELDPAEFDIGKDLLLKPFGRDELLERVVSKIQNRLGPTGTI